MNKIFLGLGSNVGDRLTNLNRAIKILSDKIQILKVSKIYETKPIGVENQPDFLNMAVMGQTELDHLSLFEFVKNVEKQVGRVYRYRWGPREIDIDILFYNDLIYKSKALEIPHPRLHERDFVLKPLMDLDPDFIHPVFKKSIRELYEELK
ncbi:2-amino-4-hydroxy-6-hydroxymethyldihydropteridine pyrophosphokinase [Sulfurihydrogenibium azorense Az-Fu1]|uniref:2-amino-4-hydroxy-6-hydroxymethyldihydropteridine pyrophosphokinase n=1 Tax=Sulfurihydrogenibium azorense (strain DSM 15241 / OCM 825 / Az-Fu1) TaxID=204536 RepID=C1DTG7_SULAA|nr:2-amino-4-hydroxy-6-hydroxymethyldihydropteridine diphosphokinase [Sulfurihydrogenibium azorense]ACN99500.1 2-amino-4-hydroxy-6-hydroxymethyldihydropteridine pyrophosphokinase [Sulfurihydrogenibium azorense Az-Fu1]